MQLEYTYSGLERIIKTIKQNCVQNNESFFLSMIIKLILKKVLRKLHLQIHFLNWLLIIQNF